MQITEEAPTMNYAMVGQAIAADIERHGHFQGRAHGAKMVNGYCIVSAPVFSSLSPGDSFSPSYEFARYLAQRLDLPGHGFFSNVIAWNDSNPTETVLDTLRSL